MDAKHVNSIARIISEQMQSFDPSITGSWGIHNYKADVCNGMASLSFLVQGFNFTGRIWIALDEGKDTYSIWGRKRGSDKTICLHDECYCDDFVEVIDRLVETGGEKGTEFYSNENHTLVDVVNSCIESGKKSRFAGIA